MEPSTRSSSRHSCHSSPLSSLSQSPSPPTPPAPDASKRYLSPSASSALSGSMSPDMSEILVSTDGPPPTKRRRIANPPRNRPRTTERIDLDDRDEKQDEELDRLLKALRKKRRIVVIAGAGISVSAGIPDFRSSAGLYATAGKELFDASVYKSDDATSSFHNMVRELASKAAEAKPTTFHHMLASMAEENRLLRLYSQNVDCIETSLPPLATNVPLGTKGPWPKTIQLHGGLEKMVCTKCNTLTTFQASLFQGPEPPLCDVCTSHDKLRVAEGYRSRGIGRLRPRIVLYNEFDHPDAEAIGNVSKADLRRVPDAVIVVGTSLKVPGARRLVKEMCQLTRSRRDGITAWINIDSEPQDREFKDCWDFVIRGECDHIAELVGLPRWGQLDLGDAETYMVSGNEAMEKQAAASLSRDRIDVLLESRKRARDSADAPSQSGGDKRVKTVQSGMLTPGASPKLGSSLPASKGSAPPKQSALSFTDNVTKATKKVPATAAKPRKRPSTKSKLKGPMFRTTKAGGRKKAAKDEKSDGATRLPALRPPPDILPGPVYKLQSPDPLNEPTTSSSDRLRTSTRTRAKAVDTISPTSMPHHMKHLLD